MKKRNLSIIPTPFGPASIEDIKSVGYTLILIAMLVGVLVLSRT